MSFSLLQASLPNAGGRQPSVEIRGLDLASLHQEIGSMNFESSSGSPLATRESAVPLSTPAPEEALF
jgi:hypothetical protein